MKESKFKKSLTSYDVEKSYKTDEALDFIIAQPKRNFKESIDISVRLGIDPKKSDQNVRGSITLPNTLGKKVVVAAFVDGDKADEAKKAGADFIGADDLIEKYSKDPIDFDVAITTPSQMKSVSKLAKTLGPKGLMPNPKSGTVTENIEKAVKDVKHGQARFKADQEGVIHGTFASVEMDKKQISENLDAFIDELKRLKPASSKGIYIKDIYLSTTMGPGYKIDASQY
jgi:large subunit ribosomal protein L1